MTMTSRSAGAARNSRSAGVANASPPSTSTVGVCNRGCRGNLVTITMYVRGEAVTMTSCSTCDHRTWSRSGERLDLRSLLEEIKAAQPLRKAS